LIDLFLNLSILLQNRRQQPFITSFLSLLKNFNRLGSSGWIPSSQRLRWGALENSIDQEYNSFANAMELWKVIKGSDGDVFLDFDLSLYEQGEAVFKANLRTRGSYTNLPEY